MPVYLFWGEDDFALSQTVEKLSQEILDPNWVQFNYDKIAGDNTDRIMEALNQALTPVFGMGGRLVWLVETNICNQCSEDLLKHLERVLPQIPEQSHLLLTTSKSPDKRLKSTKLLEKYAQVREFSLIPPWKTEEIIQKVRQVAQEKNIKLTPSAVELLADSVGNNSRQLWNELEKLAVYAAQQSHPLEREQVAVLVNVNTHNSLQLATAIRNGETAKALQLAVDLINKNEPALKIVATLVGQFRTWTIVKLNLEAGEKDEKAIATAAELGNPKRVYFLRKEVQSLKSKQLLDAFPLLLDLELNLKRGAEPLSTLQTKIVQLCSIFSAR